jgi:hypothetical protein
LRTCSASSKSASFREELHPFVREKFDELWRNAQHEPDDY